MYLSSGWLSCPSFLGVSRKASSRLSRTYCCIACMSSTHNPPGIRSLIILLSFQSDYQENVIPETEAVNILWTGSFLGCEQLEENTFPDLDHEPRPCKVYVQAQIYRYQFHIAYCCPNKKTNTCTFPPLHQCFDCLLCLPQIQKDGWCCCKSWFETLSSVWMFEVSIGI